ncbi:MULTISPECIES: lysylphosphatidylglycerol synthase domain-containing protein [unclassified Anaeromyxobacter]|uniref:lysylphosphatidylglycerol synthase domain-containing protein n=1 Tax=unclassified Anaeromyxobacter TaxID=2620896 RepID=UPI001F57EC10|nr:MULTISPECIES: lysylphosphatidylglycerol synthase domain-containing protein [unclassified Anaeromyxobacter]
MPLRKQALLAVAVAALAALLGGAALLAVRGSPFAGLGLAAVTLALAAAAADALWPSFDPGGTSLRAGRRDRPEVALTFDDGPGPDTGAVLDALDRAGVKATFFVLGRAAEAAPELVRETARRGHLVAQHGHGHVKLHLAGPATLAAELDRGAAAIRAAGVEPAPFFRAPHGFKSALLRRALRRRGLVLVAWTRGVWDTERPGAAAIADRACARMRGGEILLLHDGAGEAAGERDPAPARRREQTAEAIPELVRRWRAAGFRFVTLDRLERSPRAAGGGLAARLGGLAVLALLVTLGLRHADVRGVARALAGADPALLLAAALANVGGLAAQALRWHVLVRPVAPRATYGASFRALVGGYALGLVLPARAADPARAHLHARASGSPTATLLATVGLDHLTASFAFLGGLGLFGLFAPLPGWARSAAWSTLAVATAAAALAALLARREGAAAHAGWLARTWARLRSGLTAAGDPRVVARSLAAALLGWTAETLVALLCLPALHMPASLTVAVLMVVATTLSSAVSVSPGNAGVFELAAVVALEALGVDRELALAYALGFHLVHVVPVALLGVAFAARGGTRDLMGTPAGAPPDEAR